jgi:clan AA aspartic protease
MILGHVRDNLPRVMLTLPGHEGPVNIEFIVDTAFEGDLALPLAVLNRVQATFNHDRLIRLADGTFRPRPHFEVSIEWEGEERLAEVVLMDNEPLLGVELMAGYLLQVELEDGGEVSLEPL